ncbi:ATP-binding cassette domain-containing protein [Terriglobus sp.]|uniref:ATP-binding cassette domain-containing protein n=1 Tax=Terriglobus sp. TaxID=1889013 RepID=UPI003AFFB59E
MPDASPAPWLRFSCDERIGGHHARHAFTLPQPWTAIFGASGSGKTTLLRLLAGLIPQRTGICQVNGRELRNLPAHRRHVTLVDQSASVFPHLSVRENVVFAARPSGSASHDAVDAALHRFKLDHVAGVGSYLISGGEARRVVLARAILAQPQVLLLDESFSGADRDLRQQLRSILLQTQADRHNAGDPMPIVSVTHDVSEVFATAGEVLRIRDGQIFAQGAPAAVLQEERIGLLNELGAI